MSGEAGGPIMVPIPLRLIEMAAGTREEQIRGMKLTEENSCFVGK